MELKHLTTKYAKDLHVKMDTKLKDENAKLNIPNNNDDQEK